MTHERVTELDATFLGWSQLNIGAIILDPPPGRQAPDFAALREAVGKHLRRSASFRECLHAVPLHVDRPVWVDDDDFDLQQHLHRVPTAPGHETTVDELAALAAEASVQEADREHAPWGLEVVERMEGGRLGLVATVDHVRADGIAALLFFTLLLADLPDEQKQGADSGTPSPSTTWRCCSRPSATASTRSRATPSRSSAACARAAASARSRARRWMRPAASPP